MYITKDSELVYSPSDLIRFMESPFASWMERWAIECPEDAPVPDADDPMMSLLQVKGDEHEHQLLEEFKASGLIVVDLGEAEDKELATIDAMQSGADVIFQACLKLDPFRGYADFLVKVPGASSLGSYHYDVWDTKLAQSVRPYFMVQLCCYAEMLETLQGVRPKHLVVALGNNEKAQLRTDEYFSFYQNLKDRFLQTQAQFNPEDMPDPAESKSWGNWSGYAENLLLERDHLSQIANITRSQIKKLNKAGISTMQALIDSPKDRSPGISSAVFTRLKAQAEIQRASEGQDKPSFKVIKYEEGQRLGLALLPPASFNDVFFDIEGYPLEEGGLEYLWGNTYFDEHGMRQFRDFWAHDRQQEKQAFMAFIDWVYRRWLKDPAMHIYHYASYEVSACRKLMGRYGVCEHEVDELLRNEVFVDLYKVVKGGLLLGEPRYSIKNVEHLYRPRRETDVADGGASVVAYEQWRNTPDGADWTTSKILRSLRDYNVDDCDSTQELTEWLRKRQKEHSIHFIGKPEKEEKEIPEEITERTRLRDRLLERAEGVRETDPDQAALTEHFAWSLEFHRRENKPVFWRLFDRLGMTPEDLLDDPDCIGDCVRTEKPAFLPTKRARNHAYEYRFDPSQEYRAPKGKGFYLVGEDNKKVTLIKDESHLEEGIIALQAKEQPSSVISLIPDEYVRPDPIPKAIESVVRKYEAGSLGECAIIDFLERRHQGSRAMTMGLLSLPMIQKSAWRKLSVQCLTWITVALRFRGLPDPVKPIQASTLLSNSSGGA